MSFISQVLLALARHNPLVKVRGGSYFSYHHSRIALGLGERERIDRLEVKWPPLGGETQRFKDLPIDPYIAIVEGEEKWK